MKIVTIGGYGFGQATFLGSIKKAGADVFVDIRRRAGVRGKDYSFLNKTRLNKLLEGAGIRYVHLKELAPTKDIREVQKKSDKDTRTRKRDRVHLSDEFTSAYKTDILQRFDPDLFRQAVGNNAQVIVLFCVETQPEACHRSIVAEWLYDKKIAVSVEHLQP